MKVWALLLIIYGIFRSVTLVKKMVYFVGRCLNPSIDKRSDPAFS